MRFSNTTRWPKLFGLAMIELARPFGTTAAFAQEQPPPATADELAEIQSSLAADAAERRPQELEVPESTTTGGVLQSIQPDLTIVGDFALAVFSEDENHQTGEHDPGQSGFNLQQIELAFGAAVDPYFRFDGNIVFTGEGVDLEEAYATTLELPYRLQARFGQMLTRFGRINATHLHAWDFADQPFAIGRIFGGEGGRGLGVELSYLTPLPWYAELVLSATGASGDETARSFYGEDEPAIDGPTDFLYVAALKQFFPLSDSWSLLFGVSGAFGPNSTGTDNRTDVYGADLYLKWRPAGGPSREFVALQTEWLYRRRQVPDDVLSDVSGYAQLVYRFARRFSVAGRYEFGSPARGGDGRVAEDPIDPEWTADRTRVSANVTHYPTEYSRFRLQGSRDAGLGDAVWAGFLTAEVAIGAHGAHAF